ncbi:MAG: helix-turn-helix domain-containing protein [Magnetovibrionaceae bacterium]
MSEFNAVDIHVGSQLRQRRLLQGMSQEQLGVAVGLTFQQIQKYENGANRISASRLWEFAEILAVPVSYFFEGIGPESEEDEDASLMARRETLEFVRNYHDIADETQRRNLKNLIRSISEGQEGLILPTIDPEDDS